MIAIGQVYPLLLLISTGVCLLTPIFAWLQGIALQPREIIFILLSTAVITTGAAGSYLAVELTSALFWLKIENLGFLLLTPFWLIFTLRYIGGEKWLNRWTYAVMGTLFFIGLILLIAPPNPLTWFNPRLEPITGGSLIEVDRGPIAWIFVVYTSMVAIIVMGLFLNVSLQVHGYYRWRIRLIPVASLVPFLTTLHDVLRLPPIPLIRLGPFGFTFFSLALYFTIVHQRFGELIPVARDTILDNLKEVVIALDLRNRLIDLNAAAAALLDRTQAEAIGEPLKELLPPLALEVENYDLQRGMDFEVQILRAGKPRIFDAQLSPVKSQSGQVLGKVVVLQDITERRATEDRLRFLALHDDLTGLANRASFVDQIEQALARSQRRERYRVALLFLDLDDFKEVNDELGHAMGDKLLIAVAHRLRSSLRSIDSVGRLGGDEFVVLLEGLEDLAQAETAANRVLDCFRQPYQTEGHQIQINASIGLAFALGPDADADGYMRAADRAMYRAKAQGGGQIVVSEPGKEMD